MVSNGYAIEVEDRGLGLTAEEYAAINARLANPPEFDLADSDRLGLFVVARLAERHGIQVLLRRSPFGGTTAIVLMPRGADHRPGRPARRAASEAAVAAQPYEEESARGRERRHARRACQGGCGRPTWHPSSRTDAPPEPEPEREQRTLAR